MHCLPKVSFPYLFYNTLSNICDVIKVRCCTVLYKFTLLSNPQLIRRLFFLQSLKSNAATCLIVCSIHFVLYCTRKPYQFLNRQGGRRQTAFFTVWSYKFLVFSPLRIMYRKKYESCLCSPQSFDFRQRLVIVVCTKIEWNQYTFSCFILVLILLKVCMCRCHCLNLGSLLTMTHWVFLTVHDTVVSA